MNIQEIIEKSPILVNKYVWAELMSYSSDGTLSGERVKFSAVKLEYKKLTESEKSLLSDEAKKCCYPIEGEESKYEFEGYYCFVGDGEIPETWKEMVEENGIFIEVPTEIFDEDFFSVKTKRIKRLDMTYKFSQEWLESQCKMIGVPYVAKARDVVRELFGSEEKNAIKEQIEASESKIAYPNNFTSIFQYPSLQDVAFQGCKNHDVVSHHTYNYNIAGNQLIAQVDTEEDKVIVKFTSDEVTTDNDEHFYLFFNNWLYFYHKGIKISDDSEYLMQKLREDVIE